MFFDVRNEYCALKAMVYETQKKNAISISVCSLIITNNEYSLEKLLRETGLNESLLRTNI